MILKFMCGGVWRIVDNITEADLIPVEAGQHFEGCIGAIRYTKAGEVLTQPYDGAAFLLNDNGKTIERLDNPAIHMVPCL